MCNVLIINGSFRKQNTYGVLSQIEQILISCGIKTEFIHLSDYKIESCTGCQNCINSDFCQKTDDMSVLMEKIKKSNGIIIGSPVYVENLSGNIKNFVDRTFRWYHIPEIAEKPTLFAGTASATGLKNIVNSFKSIAISWGTPKTNFILRTARNIKRPITKKEMVKFIKLLEEGNCVYKPSFYEINIFQIKKILALKSNGKDKKYWMDNDLFNKNYYHKCKMGVLKNIFSIMIFKLLVKLL